MENKVHDKILLDGRHVSWGVFATPHPNPIVILRPAPLSGPKDLALP